MLPLKPRGYVCYRTKSPIVIDGKMDDEEWSHAGWSDRFVDIEGPSRPQPRFKTRMKMLWDDKYLYVAAYLEEPHVWGTLTKKNSVIFYDNDFEVFIDPDGDHHNYYEFEINPLNTIWELTLGKPYRDGGPAKLGTNLKELQSAVHIDGTFNDPSDTDKGWSVEIAFPWKGLAAYRGKQNSPPKNGDQWRINFSRVEWVHDIIHGKYRKIGKPARAEDNWVWSPQGLINMHCPERWGYLQFSTDKPGTTHFRPDPTLPARDMLMGIYHLQKDFHGKNRRWAKTLHELGLDFYHHPSLSEPLKMKLTRKGYRATLKVKMPDGSERTLSSTQDSRIVVE